MAVQRIASMTDRIAVVNKTAQTQKSAGSVSKVERNDVSLLKSEALKNNALANISFKGYETRVYSRPIPDGGPFEKYTPLDDEVKKRYYLQDKRCIFEYPENSTLEGDCLKIEKGLASLPSINKGEALVYVFDPDDKVTSNEIGPYLVKYNYLVMYMEGADIISEEEIENATDEQLGYIIEDLECLSKSYAQNVVTGKKKVISAGLDALNAQMKLKNAREALLNEKNILKTFNRKVVFMSASKKMEKANANLEEANSYYNAVTVRRPQIEDRLAFAKARYEQLHGEDSNPSKIEEQATVAPKVQSEETVKLKEMLAQLETLNETQDPEVRKLKDEVLTLLSELDSSEE